MLRTEHFDLLQVAHQAILLNGVSLTGKESITCQHQAHQIALGATAGEYARIASLIANLSTQPFNQLHLDDGG